MKRLLILFFLLPTLAISQDYLELFRVGLTHNFSSTFNDTDLSSTVNSIDIRGITGTQRFSTEGLYLGADFKYFKLQPFPLTRPADLYSTTLIVGWNKELSGGNTAELRLLPKLSSDYGTINSSDVYLGGYFMMKQYQSRRYHIRYGVYVSDEAYGIISSPIFGLYYLSDKNDFEADIMLPFSFNFAFELPHFWLGLEYEGMNRSYRLYDFMDGDVYAEQKRAEFSGYFKLRTLSPNAWAKAKFGYAFNSLAVYDLDDNIPLKIVDFGIGDDRQRLNPNLGGSLFFKVELIYRFPL